MQRPKMILSTILVSVLAMTLIPMAITAPTGSVTITLSLPTGYTLVSPGYFYYWDVDATGWQTAVWGTAVPAWGTPPRVTVKFPAQLIANNPAGKPRLLRTGKVEMTGGTVVGGPVAEADLGGTYAYTLESTSPASAKVNYGRAGPEIDIFRGKVIKSPDAALIAMQTGQADVSTDLIRPGDVEKLTGDGHTITYDAGFHMGHIGYNIRPLATQHHADGSPRRPDTTIWPLADVAFRHALFHCYDQYTIVASIYGYTVTPVQSLVPPAQGGWVNPAVPTHPYNPGNPKTSTAGDGTSCGILMDAGYVFVDVAPTGVGDEDYWTIGGVKMPKMTLWSPTYETAPTSAEHAARFVTDLGYIGLAATIDNGHSGFVHEPAEFADYMDKVDAAEFDAYMVFWSLGRFPDHLYDMCHSSQICGPEPANKGKYNKPGINDPGIDADTYIIKTSLSHAAKMTAAHHAQMLLYDETRSNAMAYMQLYSRFYFNGFNKDLLGIMRSPGYGSDNGWTHLNIHWKPGSAGEAAHTNAASGKRWINWIWGESPERLNPCYASTVYAWDLMGKTMDGLMDVNPYTHEDMTAMSSQLPTVVQVGTHMEITYYIRKDIFWQDGNPYTAHDAKFNWDFIKYNKIPRYTTTWMYIDHVDIIDDYTVKVVTNATSQFLKYDFAGTAATLPPNVWAPLNNTGLPNILAYDPSLDTNAAGMGPWFGTDKGAKTRLFGTGPFVFDYWDPVGMVWEGHQFPGFYRLTAEVINQKIEMFHSCGDVNRNGWDYAEDRGAICLIYTHTPANPDWDVNCDIWPDNRITFIDLSYTDFHWNQKRTYPTP